MGLIDSYKGASLVAKIAMGLLFSATIESWIAFTTSSWAEVESGGTLTALGIWRSCTGSTSSNTVITCNELEGTPTEWYAAFQAFSIFGFILTNVAFALVIFFVFVDKCKADREVALATAITGIAAAVCWLVAVIIFGVEYDDLNSDFDLKYSFGVAIVALVLDACGGVAMIFAQGGGSATKPSG